MSTSNETATVARPMFKRDALREIERRVQKRWQDERVFEVDAPTDANRPEKFLVTFPYPYMNGRLHLGHSFTLSKADFAARFERLLGKKVLFPFGFHCTGMPIKAAADKLKKELATFGCPPQFPSEDATTDGSTGPSVVAKHSKVAAKTGGFKYQWNIMEGLGIPAQEIPQFAEPLYWTRFFPPVTQQDMNALGVHVDWRRSFITTDANPFYDSFIRWQFNKLRAQNKIQFGKRYTVFSPLDGQPCLDHDRQSGENVEPKEYTGLKMRIDPDGLAQKPWAGALGGRPAFLIAATLRPETMYGQTNCWVGPDVKYGAFKMAHDEVFICTDRAVLNMVYQGFAEKDGVVEKLATVTGVELLNLKVEAPLSIYKQVYVLPMMTVAANKGTGIVTSVPSNSPDDFAALRDLRDKEALRKKYDIPAEHVLPFTAVSMIDCEVYGQMTAETVCTKLGVRSQNDRDLLERAKEMCYREDFYNGRMCYGPFSGRPVAEAKPLIRAELLEHGQAIVYYEPENTVISRSGDECVVSLVDQWFLAYGEEEWRRQAEECVAGMNFYGTEVRNQFEATLNWMQKWACSRSFGLGSRMPWDPTYLIESLSDSTIYMAYYTVAHILHQGSFDGSVRPHGISPDQMTDEVWEYIFGDGPVPQKCNIGKELLDRMKREFEYFYPVDLRVSGKDLVPNHLTFFIYTHVALFPRRFWPRSIRANGHMLLNSQKMSKSTGNFMTLREAVEEFTADATRLALADAGDGIEDANFLKETCNSAILRFYTNIELFREVLEAAAPPTSLDGSNHRYRTGPATTTYNFADRVFESEISQAIVLARQAYEATSYRDAIKYAFYELQNARDRYRDATVVHGKSGMHRDLLLWYIEVQALIMVPVTPHISEYIWAELLGRKQSIMVAGRWPEARAIDASLLAASGYLQKTAHELRLSLNAETHPKKAKPGKTTKSTEAEQPPKVVDAVELFVAETFPRWQEEAIAILQANYDPINRQFSPDDVIVAALGPLKTGLAGRTVKRLVPFVMELKRKVLAEGPQVLQRQLVFDEVQALQDNADFLACSLGLLQITITPVKPDDLEAEAATAEDGVTDKATAKSQTLGAASIPGQPTARFYRRERNDTENNH